MQRRKLFKAAGALSATALLAGCGVVSAVTVNGVTTVTFNIAKANSYVQAISAVEKALVADPLIAAVLGVAGVTAVNLIVTNAAAAMSAIEVESGGSATLVFNSAAVPAMVQSLLTDASNLMETINAAVAKIGTALSAATAQFLANLQATVALLLALATSVA